MPCEAKVGCAVGRDLQRVGSCAELAQIEVLDIIDIADAFIDQRRKE